MIGDFLPEEHQMLELHAMEQWNAITKLAGSLLVEWMENLSSHMSGNDIIAMMNSVVMPKPAIKD